MNCWQVLGIEPTRNPSEIRAAYSQQIKFANADERVGLERALQTALAEAGVAPSPEVAPVEALSPEPAQTLSAADHQVVREVVLQVRALLNDRARINDASVWKAVLTAPPADQHGLRMAIAESLEGQLRPLATQENLPAEVVDFLGEWFSWEELTHAGRQAQPSQENAESMPDEDINPVHAAERESMKNFWPAAIGWIIGLVVLTSLFSNMGGS